jgi:hypothetical protein
MKRIIFLGLTVLFTIQGTSQEKKLPLEGAWEMVYSSYGAFVMIPGPQTKGSQIKIWSKEYFLFVGHTEMGTNIEENYGGGTYKLNGNRYEENLLYFPNKSQVGQTVRLLLEIRNDTLIQKWPADENWDLAKQYRTEKYVRLK